mmetsp:Transcript_42399/g.78429  ORF Transcript_42399/g.78429 Transcript_42399/m.78429 type:complete len:165 (-) Transcript_42399:1130-1624(-)
MRRGRSSRSRGSAAPTNLGMSTEQLQAGSQASGGAAATASSLSQVQSSSAGGHVTAAAESKLRSALDVYRTERCLIASCFSHERTEECNALYLAFCERAADQERKRLDRLIGSTGQRSCIAGRHVHHLNGPCGHRAVLHSNCDGGNDLLCLYLMPLTPEKLPPQ